MGALAEGAHWDSVLLAYGATTVILGALIVLSVAASRRAKRELETLERRGPRRRAAR